MSTPLNPNGPVNLCTIDLSDRVTATEQFKKDVLVTSLDDFIARISSGGPRPVAGILYEGARPASTGAGSDINISAEFVFSLLVAIDQPTLNLNINKAPVAHSLLDALRDSIHGARGPTGHKWKWVVEAPVAVKGVVGVWLQRWSIAAQLPPKSR